MKRLLTSFALLIAFFLSVCASTKVYMLRLDDEIGSSTWHYTRQALKEATDNGADLIVVHLNTYGGSVVHADSIRTSLLNSPLPVVAYVDNNAASAGALIALACDTVVMRRGATMGAVTVVNGTDGAAMPDKYQSYMRAMMRSTAESHGKLPDGSWRRDPLIAEAMVDSRVEVPGLIDSTRVLTFTVDEAIKWKYADSKAESLKEALSQIGVNDYQIEEYKPTWTDHLIGFFTNPAVQAILIMIIVGGIYMELHTSGMGFPSAAALIAACLYFLPIYITGIASSWIILIFVLGLILILLEIFVVPGFGVTGIAGIVCVCASLMLGLIENYTFTVTHTTGAAIWWSVGTFLSGVFLAIILIGYLTSSHGPNWVRRNVNLTTELRNSEGFIGVDMQPAGLVGLTGIAATDLRPSGKAEINGERLDAVSIDGFIHAGTEIRVMKYENAQIYVKEC
ncbi:MAG: nodulation protein NfeD [Muribaculaceae bacterium]|nr:nodulation protein NfeD [Muribaculaceae bacterium]